MYIRRMNPKINKAIFSGACSLALFICTIFLVNIENLSNEGLLHVFSTPPQALYLLLFVSPPFFWFVRPSRFAKQNIWPLLTGWFFASFLLFGVAIDILHDLRPLFAGVSRTCTTLFVWAFLTFFFYALCLKAFTWLETWQHTHAHTSEKPLPIWLCIAMLSLGWIPYLVVFFPGTICADNLYMYEWTHNLPDGYFSSHHGVVPTLLFGGFPDFLTNLFGSFAIGTFIMTLVFALILGTAVIYSLITMRRLSASFACRLCALLFFAFMPVFGLFSQWIGKDTAGFAFLLFFLSFFAQALHNLLEFCKTPGLLVGFCISGVFCALFRQERILIVAVCVIILIALSFRERTLGILAGICMVFPLLLPPIINASIEAATRADNESKREAFSMFYNTTARYVRDASEDVTPAEKIAIEQMLGDYDNLPYNYLAWIADPIKNSVSLDGDILQYLTVWIYQGIRHPSIYLSAIAEQTYGFWALAPQNDIDQDWAYATTIFSGIPQGFTWPGEYRVEGELQTNFLNCLNALHELPILNVIMRAGFYVWMLFFSAGYVLFTKQKRAFLFLLPFFFMWLVCLASPLAASIRYAIGIIGGTPLFLTMCFWGDEPQLKEKQLQDS